MVVAATGFQGVKMGVPEWLKLCTFRFQNGVGDTVGDTVGGTFAIWFASPYGQKDGKKRQFLSD